jgi:hypothetical protein
MSPEKRTAIFRWVLAIATLVLAGLNLPLRQPSLADGILFVTLVALIALVLNLGVKVGFGTFTFMPVTVLMTYLVLGREGALAATVVGLIVGGSIQLVRGQSKMRAGNRRWLVPLARCWRRWPIMV